MDRLRTTPFDQPRGSTLSGSTTRFFALVICAVAALTACGSGDASDPALSTEAAEGRRVMRSSGCAACHGSNGDGGVGPGFKGLFGSEVLLDDGTIVIADRAYLEESITDPRAKIVDGYNLPMPTNRLDAAEIASVIAYIEEITTTQVTAP